jgi:hypothetical protein
MAWHILFSKNPLEAKKNLGKILLPKFLLHVLVEFSKVLPNSNFIEIWKSFPFEIFPWDQAQPTQLALSTHPFPAGYRLPHLA